VAIVAPGRAYSPSAPLLDFARLALLQHGFTVQQVWWDSTARGDEDPHAWVVGGRADQFWDVEVARELGEAGCDVLEVADADHSMGTPDAVRTAEIHLEVTRAVETYLSVL